MKNITRIIFAILAFSAFMALSSCTWGEYVGTGYYFILLDETGSNELKNKYVKVNGTNGTVTVQYKGDAPVQFKGTKQRVQLYDGTNAKYNSETAASLNLTISVFNDKAEANLHNSKNVTITLSPGGSAVYRLISF